MGILLFIGESKGQTEKTVPITIIPKPTMRYILPEPEPENIIIEEIDLKLDMIEKEFTTEELFAKYFHEEDYNKTLDILAKVLIGESEGVYARSITNCAAVVWCILNRVDIGKRGHTPIECAIARKQFAYDRNASVLEHFRELAEDVLGRWLKEKEGEIDVGRVLPKEYIFFTGNGVWNRFRKTEGGKRFIPKHSEIYGD